MGMVLYTNLWFDETPHLAKDFLWSNSVSVTISCDPNSVHLGPEFVDKDNHKPCLFPCYFCLEIYHLLDSPQSVADSPADSVSSPNLFLLFDRLIDMAVDRVY